MKASPFIYMKRLALVGLMTFAVFCAISCRLVQLHIIESPKYVAAIESQRFKLEQKRAKRGDITDIKGNLLATSYSVITVAVDPTEVELQNPREEAKLCRLAEILNLPSSLVLEKCRKEYVSYENKDGIRVTKPRRYKVIQKDVDEKTFEKIAALKIKGLTEDRKYIRKYPSEGLAAHVIGFVNKEGAPVCGAELMCEYYLKAQDGWILSEKDARKNEIPHLRTRDVPMSDGMNVELTIDVFLQEIAQRELQRIVEEYNPDNAAIIVSDPSTGYIGAMASYPSFDPNSYNNFPAENLKNFAISSQVEPGSTFKVVPIAAALNEQLVTQDDTFDCSKSTASYKGRILKLPKEAHTMGVLSVRQIAEKSSNRGVTQLGIMMGEKKLYEYASLFGYGKRTNIGLSGEIPGTLNPVNKWDGLTITRLPMGHAVAATPLQMHCAMSAIANDGVYMQPQLVRRVYFPKSGQEILFPPKRVRQAISGRTAKTMQSILTGVVGKDGTAQRAAVEGYKVAGKTGTTQKIIDNKYSTKNHVASFTGFFPADRPRLAITVVVDNPHSRGIGYGGIVAAPAFASVARQAASYLGIQTDEEYEKVMAWKGIQ